MNKISLTALAREHLEVARAASSGRSAHTVYGGHEHSLRQTLIALRAGSELDEHDANGEATLQVLHGRVRLTNQTAQSHIAQLGEGHIDRGQQREHYQQKERKPYFKFHRWGNSMDMISMIYKMNKIIL